MAADNGKPELAAALEADGKTPAWKRRWHPAEFTGRLMEAAAAAGKSAACVKVMLKPEHLSREKARVARLQTCSARPSMLRFPQAVMAMTGYSHCKPLAWDTARARA